MFRRNFLFGQDSDTANVIGVNPSDLYKPGRGYGFVAEENRREQELLQIPELNSGFDTVYWYRDASLTVIEGDINGCFVDCDRILKELEEKNGERQKGERRRLPLSFKVDVPRQGNYRVTLTIRTQEPMDNVLIFSGRRRLSFLGNIPGDTVFTHTMTVNVCDIVPRGQTRIYADTTLDITVVADRPRISSLSVAEVNCPTIYIAGDSTVTDQSADYPYAPGTSYCGWGQMITAYLNDKAGVSNHAHSGLTTDSFRKEGHYAVIDQYRKPGDFFFFQFGHNDQKLNELKAFGGYRNNLARYINECRDKGGYPVLVTPVARNSWKGNDGSYNDLLAEYAESCREIGRRLEVPVLDLHQRSMDFIQKQGLEEAKAYFFPDDYTHTNDYGAYKMAGFVAEEIQRVCSRHPEPGYCFLAKCVTEGYGEWKAKGPIVLPKRPAAYENVINPVTVKELLSEVEDLEKEARRADVLDMIIKTVRFFPTNVYNDMFVDVVGHEWYAGTVECAYQNGMIDPHLVEKGHFYPERPVTLEEFVVLAINGYRSRKRIPREEPCLYDQDCSAYARPFVRAACAIGMLPLEEKANLHEVITRGLAVEMCRRMNV